MATIRYDKQKLQAAKAALEAQGVDVDATGKKNEQDIMATDI